MAAGEAHSLTKGSDIFEYCCTPCSKGGYFIEAINLCADCAEYLCTKCIKVHNRLGATSGHKVLDQKDIGKTKGSNPQLPTQRCKAHGGEPITAFCGNHDVVCCNTGVAVNHKNCDGVQYIMTAASGISTSQSIQKTKSSISSTLQEAKGKKSSRQTYLANLDKDKALNIQQVQDFTERQIHRIRKLEKAIIEEIKSKHMELSAVVNRDVAFLDDLISTLEGDLKKLDCTHISQEAQTFVNVKLSQRHETEAQTILRLMIKPRKSSLNIKLNANIENFMKDIRFVDDSRVYMAKLKDDYNVKVRADTATCDITGSCQLPDGTLMITDYENGRLKRLDASYRVTDHRAMEGQPYGVTCTCLSPCEIAVTLTGSKMVQFVTVGESLVTTSSFNTNERCRGICYSGGQLYVSCGGLKVKGFEEGPGHVAVFSLQGVLIHKIQTDQTGQQIFTFPYHTSVSPNDDKIYIADWDAGVKVLNKQGTLVDTCNDPLLRDARGVCSLDNGQILVCGQTSNNVLQFDSDGRKATELLKVTDGIKAPMSLCYDNCNFRLVVTMGETDFVKVFDLK